MGTFIRRLQNDQRGFALVWVVGGLLAFLSASMLAVDVGQLMVARSQSQNAADAGALAGATALAFNSYTDHSASGPAVIGAINAAQANPVIGQPPSVTSGDVTFPQDPTNGQFDRVQVSVYRTTARGNPLANMIAQVFGMPTVDINATATAAAAYANAEICVLPWTIPDKWIEEQCTVETCPWAPDDTFDLYATKGNSQNSGAPLPNPDIYIPPGQPNPTGYNPDTDRGLEVVLKNNNQNKISPSLYNPWDLPGSTGGNDYSNNIATCNTNIIKINDFLTPETGNMTGPTQQGVNLLIASDPGAYWEPLPGCNCVKNSAFPISRRCTRRASRAARASPSCRSSITSGSSSKP
jgi:Putative Flp pilus-assembly TadE/G-like